MSHSKVKTRFAPSPTGHLHIGGIRTALYSWLYAKKYNGEFIVRIEDTDQERSTDSFTESILKNLSWLGLNSDAPISYQKNNQKKYLKLAKKLVEENKAYYCHCSKERINKLRDEQKKNKEKPQYDNHCRELSLKYQINSVIRLKVPLDGNAIFHDEVYGTISVNNKELDDLIIIRSDNLPTYNFAVTVDDLNHEITHVIRGDDHLNNTFRQLHIFQALEQKTPIFAHCPMVLGTDGSRLSKRHGATDVGEYKKQGYLPQTLLNYLLRLGWSNGDQEIFSLDDMLKSFDLKGINKSAPKFDLDKINWMNQQWIKKIDFDLLLSNLHEPLLNQKINLKNKSTQLQKAIELFAPRATTLVQIAEEISFIFQDEVVLSQELQEDYLKPNKNTIDLILMELDQLEEWKSEFIMLTLKSIAKSQSLKMPQVGMPFRVAISGRSNTPDISKVAEILGKTTTIERLKETQSIL